MWLIGTILGHEIKALDAMNNLGLLMTWTTLGCNLRALDAMNGSGLWVDDLNNFGSWGYGFGCYEQLMGVVDMNDFRSWPLVADAVKN